MKDISSLSKNKRTIETPPDLQNLNDISLKKVNLNLKDKFHKVNLKQGSNKYKLERDTLIKVIK